MTSAKTSLFVTLTDAVRRGTQALITQQRPDGAWEGEVVWNSMLLAQYVIVRRIVGRWPIAEVDRDAMLRYFARTSRPDGSFGMHPDSAGYLFFTTLAYVAMRLLGLGPTAPVAQRAMSWIRSRPGGVLAIPSWGKVWLSFLGLYDYDGVNPVAPELFLAPRWLPFHPDRFYCHTRYVYLALAYLYGRRFAIDLGELTAPLRDELYGRAYGSVNFAAERHRLADSDVAARPSSLLTLAYDAAFALRGVAPLRRRALGRCLERIRYEQRETEYRGISPVSSLLNCLALFAADSADPDLTPSLDALESWRWADTDGIRYVGARSTSWDTAFAARALVEVGDGAEVSGSVGRACDFLRRAQIHDELPNADREQRDTITGGWCFSGPEHRWPVSDCTAEVVTTLVRIPTALGGGLDRASLRSAVRFMLSRQNGDGGFASYERQRGGSWLDSLNPSEMYLDCMVERSYVECTASCLGALAHARRHDSDLAWVDGSVARGLAWLRARQRRDGSYSGFWGINFTYAIFHVVEALAAMGPTAGDPTVERAARWLLERQRPDGGWGEHWSSCLRDEYVEHHESQATMTAWALAALLNSSYASSPEVDRAVAFLVEHQQETGSWPRQSPAGMFFRTAALDYSLYRSYFPLLALTRRSRSETVQLERPPHSR